MAVAKIPSHLASNVKKILDSKKINGVLAYLSEKGKMGWEKWIQYELAFALREFGDIEVESKFAFDKTKSVALKKAKNENGYIDILFRPKNTAVDYFVALELKLGKTDRVVRALLSDLIKISACKREEWQYRSVVAMGIVRDDAGKKTKFNRAVQQLIDEEIIQVSTVKNTNFKILTLAWSVPPGKAKRKNFTDWLFQIEDILKTQEVSVKKKKVAGDKERGLN